MRQLSHVNTHISAPGGAARIFGAGEKAKKRQQEPRAGEDDAS
jgi:hypothetical protein